MLVDAPTKQNASAMHTSTSSWSKGGGGGLNGSSRSAVLIHEIGKTCWRRPVPYLWGMPAILRCFGSLDVRTAVPPSAMTIKIVVIQWFLKFL
jgi:hypothetical protein